MKNVYWIVVADCFAVFALVGGYYGGSEILRNMATAYFWFLTVCGVLCGWVVLCTSDTKWIVAQGKKVKRHSGFRRWWSRLITLVEALLIAGAGYFSLFGFYVFAVIIFAAGIGRCKSAAEVEADA